MNDQLLSIDLDAELEKLSLGRLRNLDQAPVALARAAAQARPQKLSIEITKSRIRLFHDGRVPDPEVLQALKILFDYRRDDQDRQAALEELEELGMLDLLVAFALKARRVELRLGAPAEVELLLVGRGDGARVFGAGPAPGARGVKLSIQGAELRPAGLIEELSEALRYASFAIELNGQRVDRGLRLDQVVLQHGFRAEGFQAVVGLPRRGSAATLRVLTNGVFEKEAWESPSDGRVFEAVVDYTGGAQAARIKEMLREQVGVLYRRLGEGYQELGAEDQVRARELLFRLADHGAGEAALAEASVFATVAGELHGIEGLRRAAQGRVVRAVAPGARPERFVLDGEVFVLDPLQRGFIEKHLKLMVREPPRRPRRRLNLFSGLLEHLRAAGRGLWNRLSGRRVLQREKLGPVEREFLSALERLVRSADFMQGRLKGAAFGRGRFSGWRVLPDGRLLLSVNHPRVIEMLEAFERDPQSLLASLILLSEGRENLCDLTDSKGLPIFPG